MSLPKRLFEHGAVMMADEVASAERDIHTTAFQQLHTMVEQGSTSRKKENELTPREKELFDNFLEEMRLFIKNGIFSSDGIDQAHIAFPLLWREDSEEKRRVADVWLFSIERYARQSSRYDVPPDEVEGIET